MAGIPKLLACVWLPGLGCRHLRSSSMSVAEAIGLIEVARGAVERSGATGELQRIEAGAGGVVFVMPRRHPDPDHPGRTAPGYVLISIPDPEAYLREAVAGRLGSMECPGATGEPGDDWESLDLGAAPRDDARAMAVGPAYASGREAGPRSPRFKSYALRLCLVLASFLLGRWSQGGSPAPSSPGGRTPALARDDPSEWARQRLRIAALLRDERALRIMGRATPEVVATAYPATEEGDRRLLEDLALLIRRPSLGLSKSDRLSYGRVAGSEHPFSAFLDRLPDVVSAPGDVRTARGALDAANRLRAESGPLLDAEPDGEGGEWAAGPILGRLDYVKFFADWSLEHPGVRCEGPLDEGREYLPGWRWVADVRKSIRRYCGAEVDAPGPRWLEERGGPPRAEKARPAPASTTLPAGRDVGRGGGRTSPDR